MRWYRIAAAAAVVATVVGGIAAYVGAVHNAQGEFTGPDGSLSPTAIAPVFLSWFVIVFIAGMAFGGIIRLVARERQGRGGS